MEKQKVEKNETAEILFRIDKDLKKRFQEIAKANDEIPSLILRKFVKKYLEENAQTRIKF